MSDGYKTAMIVNKLFDIECSTDEAIELEHLMWGTQICRTCAGNSVGDYAIRIQELEQQLTSAHRSGWEQAKREAQQALCEICCYNSADNPVPDECTTCNERRAIASMEYKGGRR